MEMAALRGHEGGVTFAAFGFDGRQIVTASKDGTARIWSVLTGQQLIDYAWCIVPQRLTKEERDQFLLDPDPSSAARPRSDLDCEQLRQ